MQTKNKERAEHMEGGSTRSISLLFAHTPEDEKGHTHLKLSSIGHAVRPHTERRTKERVVRTQGAKERRDDVGILVLTLVEGWGGGEAGGTA